MRIILLDVKRVGTKPTGTLRHLRCHRDERTSGALEGTALRVDPRTGERRLPWSSKVLVSTALASVALYRETNGYIL